MTQNADDLLAKYPLISDQVDKDELRVILNQLDTCLEDEAGSVVEFGCYIGTTSLFIRRLLDARGSKADFYVYDSFEGLPEKSTSDLSPAGEQFRAGELQVSKKDFIMQFKKAGLRLPRITKGWFGDLSEADVPNGIIFAYLDGDYYESIMTPLKLIWPKLRPGAVIVVDDYANEALPGAAKAVDDWLRNHSASLRVESSLAVITSPR